MDATSPPLREARQTCSQTKTDILLALGTRPEGSRLKDIARRAGFTDAHCHVMLGYLMAERKVHKPARGVYAAIMES